MGTSMPPSGGSGRPPSGTLSIRPPSGSFAARPPTQSLVGRRLKGRYRIEELLGRGASSAVYAATDEESGQPVVLKVAIGASDGHCRRWEHEAAVLRSLEHPCLPRLLDDGALDDRTPFLVLVRLRGETLAARLERDRVLPSALVCRLLHRAARALSAAHLRGVVHRDLKPSNLFVCGPPEAPTDLCVLDFGLSKSVTPLVDSSSHLTDLGMTVGTAEYMTPEQALTDPVDGRTDIYALGVVLFRALTGHLPFAGGDKMALLAHHVATAPPPLPPPHAPSLAALVARTLRKRPEHRYPSMDALADDLLALSDASAPIVPPPPGSHDIYAPRSAFGAQVVRSYYELLDRPVPDPLLGLADEED